MGGSSYRFSKSLAVIKENVDVEREKYGIYFLYRTLRSVLRHLCPVHELNREISVSQQIDLRLFLPLLGPKE